MTEMFALTREELRRIEVLSRVEGGHLTALEAAKLLELSIRQVRRILAAYRKEGPAALAHGNRGRKPKHAISDETKQRVIELAQAKYSDYNHQHLSEKLEGEGIAISRPSVRRILGQVGIKSPKTRRSPKHRSRRERYPQEGMLVQVDGSPHDWLEGRGPRLTLHFAIDDATGRALGGVFRLQEDAAGYLELFRQVVLRHGIPLAAYHDRHDIFVQKPTAAQSALSRETIEEQLKGSAEPTQVGRALIELGIRSIKANSPEAKGRVERAFQTLQDRLVKALREAGAATVEEANAVLLGTAAGTAGKEAAPGFLAEFNRLFAVPAADPELGYRKLPEGFCAEQVFCFKYLRSVASDNTISFFGQGLQLLADGHRTSFAKARVEVHERLDGSLAVYHQGHLLATRAAPSVPKELRARRGERPRPKPIAQAAQANGPSEAVSHVAPTGSQEDTARTIEQSKDDAATTSDALALKRDGGSEAEGSNRRASAVGYVDKWTGERIAPPRPSPNHPWKRPLKAQPNRPPANQTRVTESLNA